ncbi:hypothetical protein [Kitasatospora purpeofusca]|uniref:hypothetical protein n=1 Tax=Kitasatospora purpeofusca TaxID=67352 RepID=UPI0036D2CAAF
MPPLHHAPAAARTLRCLQRRVRRALDQLVADPRHPGPRTHRRVFDSYVETGADSWRIHWTWGPDTTGSPEHDDQDDGALSVLLIGPHR